jgi:hypothetical protein
MKISSSQYIASKIVAKMKHFPTTLPVYAFDFADAGSRPAIDQALSRLARRGKLYRLGWGLYIYPHKNLLTGQMRMPTADAVARSFARKLGHRILPSRPYASNLLRLSTQVPAKNVYITDGRSRVVQIGPHTLYFHHVEPSTLAAGGRVAPLVFQALRDIGRKRVSDADVSRLRQLLPDKDRKSLLRCIRFAPVWMQPVLKAIAENKKVGSYGFRRQRRNGGLENDDIATN